MRITASRSLIVLGLFLVASTLPAMAQQSAPGPAATGPQITLMSSAYRDGGDIPAKYTCTAKPSAVSPALQWINVPQGAVTYVLIFHDPDSHRDKASADVTHWIMWNIPATLTQLPEGIPVKAQMDDGTIQGKSVRGANGYQGPCPPAGRPHHYSFDLYVLDTKLSLGPDATREEVMKAMDGHVLGSAIYVGLYHQ